MTADAMRDLAAEFWRWRLATVQDSSDDITRVERPAGWVADWSGDAVAARREQAAAFVAEYRKLDLSDEPVEVQVDGRLLGSALARVHWELDLLRSWQRNPCFYLDQALVPIYNLLLVPPPIDGERAEAVVRHLGRVPVVLEQGRLNLDGHAAAPFARSALTLLATAGDRLREAMTALLPFLPTDDGAIGKLVDPAADDAMGRLVDQAADGAMGRLVDQAVAALAGYRAWLEEGLPSFGDETAVGAEAFGFFLHRVALLPYPAARLRDMGRQEWDRAIASETVLRHRHSDVPPPSLPPDRERWIAKERAAELDVRRFYVERGLLSQPETLRHYRFAAMPPYLAPLTWLGVEHYAGSPSRVDDDALRYVREPHADLPYFQLAEAYDPRTGIAHEGVHAQQLALSWRHPNPLRRHYYDSAANEGIAFYHEEMALQSGLFDDVPVSQVFVANAMRLRALRVEVDVALALGELTLDEAADHLARAVPMDRETAWEEAVFFSGNPGQGLSYQVGKLQILDLLAACSRQDGFDLMGFHDRLWLEGNVPIALQRWEVLGARDHLDQADRLGDALEADSTGGAAG
ncbi:DUF885 family protein [Nonomuraea sp. NPDC000554]|uniref:DUF885 family protein n=1 Tax=Nonomuraea sp. NPDC000554 TaxID=3154259 RepID=UPI00331D3449